MNEAEIINLLTNSGFKVTDIDSYNIYFQDPSCIFPAFDTMFDYAWYVILILLGIIFFSWGLLYIKNGIKVNTFFNNIKTVILILGIFCCVKPIVNIVYGNKLFEPLDLLEQQCETKKASLDSIKELLELRNKHFSRPDDYLLYENFEVIDTGAIEHIETSDFE